MSQFKIGDRVVVTENSSIGEYKDLKGLHGTVVVVRDSSMPYGVALDDRQHPSNTNGMYYFDDSELDFENHIQPCYYATVSEEKLTPYIKIEEEKKEMELLDIYFNEKQKEISKKYKEKDVKIRCKDPVYKELTDIAKKYEGVRGVVCYAGCDFEYNDEIRKALVKNDRDCDVQIDAMCASKQEIKAQLDICETYDQKMNVLKAYGVIDEQGKLNK